MKRIILLLAGSVCIGIGLHAARLEDLPKEKREQILKQWFSSAKDNEKQGEMIKLIKEYPKIINQTTSDSYKTALDIATEHRAHSIVYMLLDKGAKVNIKDKRGRTPVHYAVMAQQGKKSPEGHRNILKRLIENGANVNIQDKQGKTPLHYAAEIGKMDIIRPLIKAGANPAIQDENKTTPFQVAYEHNHAREMLKIMQELNAPHGKDEIPKDAHQLSYKEVNKEFILHQISKYPHIVENILIFALIDSLGNILHPPIWRQGASATPEVIHEAQTYSETVHNLLEMVIKLRDKSLKNVSTDKPIHNKIERFLFAHISPGDDEMPVSRLIGAAGHINREFYKIKSVGLISPIAPHKTLKLFIQHGARVPESAIELIHSEHFRGKGKEKMLQVIPSHVEAYFKNKLKHNKGCVALEFGTLLEAKDINKTGINNVRNEWFEAAQTGNKNTIITLLSKYPHIFNIKNKNGLTAIQVAIQQKNNDTAYTLLRVFEADDTGKINSLIKFAQKHNPSFAERIREYVKKDLGSRFFQIIKNELA